MERFIQAVLIGLWVLLLLNSQSIKAQPLILNKFLKNGVDSGLPDFSYAGCCYGAGIPQSIPERVFNVVDYGAFPNDNGDDTNAINEAIVDIGKKGGGIVFFPAGKYYVNSSPDSVNIIRIDYDNVVLQGAGVGDDGTVIYSCQSTLQSKNPWLSPFTIHTGLKLHDTKSFYSVNESEVVGHFIKDAEKGCDVIALDNTSGIHAGDIIILAMKNTNDDGDLMNALMHPLEFESFQTSYLEAGVRRDPSFQWMVEVEQVLDGQRVKLCQPLHRTMEMQYQAFVSKTDMLRNVGIEDLRFESAWDGIYQHHGNGEMDYGWGAICMHRVINGWVKNVVINNFTQTVHLVNSKNITVDNVKITGLEGHYGPKMYSSSDNLVQNIQIVAKRTHGVGLEGCSFGNVYRQVSMKYPAPIDLHGLSAPGFCPPMYNLFENISGVSSVAGGGAPENLPHAGEGNVFWDVEMHGWIDDDFNEVFYSWIWRDPIRFKNRLHIDCHKQYLKSIVVGVYHANKGSLLSIEHSLDDRNDEWIYVEGLNKPIGQSLYHIQMQNKR